MARHQPNGRIMKTLIALIILVVNVSGWEPRNAPTWDQRELIAAVIIAEAGGEGKLGMEAVYEVIWQRAALAHDTYTNIVTKRKQFSCLNNIKPAKLVRRSQKHKHYDWVRLDLLSFPPTTVHTIPKGQEQIIRNRSDHYFAHKQGKPSWSNGSGKIIGNHTFERHK